MAIVTIGVPLYNESRFVRQTIRSLKAQTSSDFVAFLSDNCSTDDTVAIAIDEIGNDNRFVLIKHPGNIGAICNFEYMLRLADSPYFMWVGGHDAISPTTVECLIETLNGQPDASMAMAIPHGMNEAGEDEGVRERAIYDFKGAAIDRYLASVRELHDCTICYAMFRREYAATFRFAPVYGCDLPFISMLLWHGRLVYDERCTFNRRMFATDRLGEQMARITGSSTAEVSRADTARYYLRTFSDVYTGTPEDSLAAQRKIMEILIERFGPTCADGWPHGRWSSTLADSSTTENTSSHSVGLLSRFLTGRPRSATSRSFRS